MQYRELVFNKGYSGFNPYDFGFEDCEPSHHYGPAVRPHWLLHYIISGFGYFEIDGKHYELSPGQIFVIPPGVTTYYQADAKKPWNYIWVGFTTKEELPVKLPDIFTAPELGSVFESMKQCMKMKSGKEAFLSGKIWELFAVLLEQTKQSADWIDIAINFMHNNYHRKLSITDIADKVGFDRSYFSSAFKKRMGMSPQSFLIKLRMEKAATLMLKSDVKPSIAAVSVGYDDIFVFSKAFKKHFGIPPREFAKKADKL
ncbi:MAG: AraC family transcriptional regulator [Clostridia bacterium]|nr:AraC family transcriptional regulator [Clostridia bacterium]